MSDSEKAPPPPIVQSLLAQAPDTKLSDLSVKLQPSDYISKFPEGHLDAIWNNWRLSCYLATAQIFLGSSALLLPLLRRPRAHLILPCGQPKTRHWSAS